MMSFSEEEEESRRRREQRRSARRRAIGERLILKRARRMLREAFETWKMRCREGRMSERMTRRTTATARRKALVAWHVTTVKERSERDARKRLMKTTFETWAVTTRAAKRMQLLLLKAGGKKDENNGHQNNAEEEDDDDDDDDDDDKKEEEEEEEEEEKEEKRRNASLVRRTFRRWHVSALTHKRNDTEKERAKAAANEKLAAERAKRMKVRWKGERKKSLACEDALEALRKSSLKELLDCDKENYDEEEMNREADENEQTSERRERLIRSLLKQKTQLEKTIEREEQRERIRARFGN